jgi:hypothetical protein
MTKEEINVRIDQRIYYYFRQQVTTTAKKIQRINTQFVGPLRIVLEIE